HELRTPLTVIQGMGKTLGQRWERLDDEMRRDLLGRVNSNADALASTINALLDFAQLEAGRLEANPAPFDVGALVERSVERPSRQWVGPGVRPGGARAPRPFPGHRQRAGPRLHVRLPAPSGRRRASERDC